MLIAKTKIQLFLKAFALSFAFTTLFFSIILLVYIFYHYPISLSKINVISGYEEEEEDDSKIRDAEEKRADIENGLRGRHSSRLFIR